MKNTSIDKNKKLIIYLGDPVHNMIKSWDIWTVPLNICCIAAYVDKFYKDKVEIRLFKFPDKMLEAIDEKTPDVVGVSNYLWNKELSKKILDVTKEKNPKAVTVMGGPNITQTKEAMTQFFTESNVDFYISLHGEDSFKCIIGAILKNDYNYENLFKDPDIHGMWYMDKDKRHWE